MQSADENGTPAARCQEADDMIASGEYSCQQIANYIANTTGEYISQVAVNRYRRKFFELEDESRQLSMF